MARLTETEQQEAGFEEYKPASFRQLVTGFRDYKGKP